MFGKHCKECYQKNFQLCRPVMKVFQDYYKIIWQCPECSAQFEEIWREYDEE